MARRACHSLPKPADESNPTQPAKQPETSPKVRLWRHASDNGWRSYPAGIENNDEAIERFVRPLTQKDTYVLDIFY
jgi:hypothetical protein